MEKTIYDVDGVETCGAGRTCPKFVINEQTNVVSLIDRQGNRASMTIGEFQDLIRGTSKAIKNGSVKALARK
jgi:hypothetical protein